MSDLNTSLAECNTKMNKAIDVAKEDFATIRTGRAHPAMFAKLMVDYYGTGTPLSQLATVQVPEARLALITPYDKGAMAAIEKAIRDSDLGVNPGSDGTVIRVNFPQLTEERRKEFVKVVKNMAEEGRVTVRSIRRDARKVLETAQKDGDISQDDLDRAEKELEQLTQATVDTIDKAFTRKEHELLEV